MSVRGIVERRGREREEGGRERGVKGGGERENEREAEGE